MGFLAKNNMALVREADVERSMDSSGHFGLAADSATMRLLLLQTAAATLLTSPLPFTSLSPLGSPLLTRSNRLQSTGTT
jgi:hypothetical protein